MQLGRESNIGSVPALATTAVVEATTLVVELRQPEEPQQAIQGENAVIQLVETTLPEVEDNPVKSVGTRSTQTVMPNHS